MQTTTLNKFLLMAVICFALSLSAFSQINLNQGLVAWYPFDGNFKDSSGNGNNGTIQNPGLNGSGFVTDRNGTANKAYYFGGSNGQINCTNCGTWVDCGNGSTLNQFQNALSVSYWVKFHSPFSYYNRIFGKQDNSSLVGWGFDIFPGKNTPDHEIEINMTNANTRIGPSHPNLDDVWYHVVVTVDAVSNVTKMYFDGTLDTTFTNQSNIVLNSTYNLNLGAYYAFGYAYYKGSLDDLRIWNRVLNAQEVAALYNGCTTLTTYYADADGDGYGNANVTTQACTQPAGYVANSLDCDDANAAINPVAPPVKQFDFRYGGGNQDQLSTIIKTADNGYLLGGKSKSPAGFEKTDPNRDATNSTYDYWIVKVDANGVKQWDKTYGGTGDESNVRLLQLLDGGYLIGGYSYSGVSADKTESSKGLSDFWVIRTNASGNIIWQKDFGGSDEDQFQVMRQTSDGNFLLAGSSASPISGDKSQASQGLNDYWVVKIDANGNKLWDKRFGGSKDDLLTEVYNTSDGGFLLGGRSYSPADGDKSQPNYDASGVTSDYWIVKIDANGNEQWDKRYGGTSDDFLFAIKQQSNKSYLLAGHSKSPASGDKSMSSRGGKDYWVINADSSGNKIWDAEYGGSADDEAYMLELTPDGGYVISGYSLSGISGDKTQASQGSRDYWVVKASSTGTKQWDFRYGGSNLDVPTGMLISNDGGIILGGYSQSGISGDKTQDNHDPSLATKDYWMVKLAGNSGYQAFYADADNDGYGNAFKSIFACTAPPGYVSNSTDCNDANAAVHPGASDICNGIDDDCNGIIDDNAITATITPSGTVDVCTGTTVLFTANTGTGITYQWIKGTKNIAGATTSTYSTNKAAAYSVKENNSFGCSSTSAKTTLNENPLPPATITPLGNLDICQTGSVVLQANSGTGLTYQWVKGSSNISGATNLTYTATKTGTYKVIVTNSSGCSKTSAGVKVTKSCKLESGNDESLEATLYVYPNPTTGSFSIDLKTEDETTQQASLQIVNLVGRIVFNETVSLSNGELKKEISLNNANSGIYMIRVMANDHAYESRLIIQK